MNAKDMTSCVLPRTEAYDEVVGGLCSDSVPQGMSHTYDVTSVHSYSYRFHSEFFLFGGPRGMETW